MLCATGCCCNVCQGPSSLPADKVLLWDTDCSGSLGGLTSAKTVYSNFGITAHLSSEWSGTLSDYGLIFFMMAEGDPSWWSQISGATWSGRILLSGEHAGFSTTNTYVNTKTALNSMTLTPTTAIGGGCDSQDGTPSAHTLTTGISTLKFSDSSAISGGTTLFTDLAHSSQIMMQQKKTGSIDWVVSGDSSWIANHCTNSAGANKSFLCNLWKYGL